MDTTINLPEGVILIGDTKMGSLEYFKNLFGVKTYSAVHKRLTGRFGILMEPLNGVPHWSLDAYQMKLNGR
jgi:hypothetical protein